MVLVKDPVCVDFIIQSQLLSSKEQIEISEFIWLSKEKNKKVAINQLFKVSDFEAVFESLRLSKTQTKSENHFLKVRDFGEHVKNNTTFINLKQSLKIGSLGHFALTAKKIFELQIHKLFLITKKKICEFAVNFYDLTLQTFTLPTKSTYFQCKVVQLRFFLFFRFFNTF